MTKEELFDNNVNIAYKLASTYRINYRNEYEDIIQIALTGLWQACLNYDGRGALSTYAYPVIRNSINTYLRHVRKNERNTSLNTPVANDSVNTLYLEDVLASDDDILEDILSKMQEKQVEETVNKVLGDDRDSEVFIMILNGKTQAEIGKKFKMSQPQVSRIKNKTIFKLRHNLYRLRG